MTTHTRLAALVFLLTTLAPPIATQAAPSRWQPIQGLGYTLAVTVDSHHNTYGVGFIARDDEDLVAVKIAPDGTQLWRTTIAGSGGSDDGAGAVAIDENGDVILGTAIVLANARTQQVVKLSGANGTEVWRSPELGTGGKILLAANGDILVGSAPDPVDGGGIAVLRLSSTDGSRIWRLNLESGSGAGIAAMALDASGNIVVAGRSNPSFFVAKVDASDGSELWRYTHSGSTQETAHGVAIDATGDVIAAGSITDPVSHFGGFGVVKLHGSSGGEAWIRTFTGTNSLGLAQSAAAFAVGVDGNGDIFAVGETTTPQDLRGEGDFIVRKLSGSDGSELWKSVTSDVGHGRGLSVAVDVDGDPIAGGWIADTVTPGQGRVFVQRLGGADGQERWRMIGRGGLVNSLAIDGPSGAVIAGGVEDLYRSPEMLVAKIGFATGGSCGDGLVTPLDEQCDDGNGIVGDGCDALCRPEEAVTTSGQAGVAITTDMELDGATQADTIETSMTIPVDGSVTILETSPSEEVPLGYSFLNHQVNISAPNGSSEDPLILRFQLDVSAVPFGADETTIAIFRNSTLIAACSDASGQASPDPCVASRVQTVDGDLLFTVLSSAASRWNLGVASCVPAAPGACHAAGAPGQGSLFVKGGPQKRMVWKSGRGTDALPGIFGDPLSSTGYTLCLVSDLLTPSVRMWAYAPSGELCGKRPCWRATKHGFRYKNPLATPNGIDTITLESGDPGSAKFTLKLRGPHIDLPPFPIAGQLPLRAQLQASNGECWEATFSSSSVSKNSFTEFSAVAD